MKFFNLNSRPTYKNINKFRIDWGKKSKSKYQFDVKQFLRPYWDNHVCYEEMTLAGTKLSVDIMNMTLRVAVEAHGDQHRTYNKFFHGDREGLLRQIERDVRKSEWCEINGITLVEIYTDDFPLSARWFEETYEIKL